MKNQSSITEAQVMQYHVSVHDLVSKLTTSLLPLAVKQHSFILNNVPTGLFVNADENLLSFILGRLMNGTVSSTSNDCIRVDAFTEGDNAMIEVKDNRTYLYSNISQEIGNIQQAAKKIGAHISINSNGKQGTTIALAIHK